MTEQEVMLETVELKDDRPDSHGSSSEVLIAGSVPYNPSPPYSVFTS